MLATLKQSVSDGVRSSGWLLWAPLLAAYAPRDLPKMYFNMHLRRYARRLVPFLDPFVTIDIVRSSSASGRHSSESVFSGELKSSDAFKEVKAYLSSACSRDVLNLCAEGSIKDDSFLLSLRDGEEVADHFRDVTLWWLSMPQKNCLRLMFPQRHRVLILDEYLPHVRREGRNVIFGNRKQRLYTNSNRNRSFGGLWSHIDFEHPATFDTLAMPPNKKRKIMEDLDNFRGNKDYYRRIGKPWKRGYLLYGPPGTGKSSMIAAMANYLNYDIYDIELTSVSSNGELRSLFVATTGKSIIVIEDIDCCLDDFNGQRMENQRWSKPSSYRGGHKVTLSGLLNFIDGVWSAQSGERIIVLTTNFPDKLDQALIRSGRMDMHVEMSYCGFEAFETLARNYLGVGSHPLFRRVKGLLQVVEITPADVAECLLWSQADVPGADDGGVETCLGRLIDKLEKKAQEEKDKNVGNKPAAKRRRY